jgi:hypothetical protein
MKIPRHFVWVGHVAKAEINIYLGFRSENLKEGNYLEGSGVWD